MTILNTFQKRALIEMREAGFEASPRGNWIEVSGGYRPEPIFTYAGVIDYIAKNDPPTYEDLDQ